MVDGEPKEYFVTVRNGQRSGFLLGPYTTHAEALAMVDVGRLLAIDADPWASFYEFGTAGAVPGFVTKTVFGNLAPAEAPSPAGLDG